MNNEQILKEYNLWRRGYSGYEMPDPTLIGIAIDSVLSQLAALKEENERLSDGLSHHMNISQVLADGNANMHEMVMERDAEIELLKARVAELERRLSVAMEVRAMSKFKVVPVEPTGEMVEAAREHHEGDAYLPASLYRAMLAAAPDVQGEPVATLLIGEPESTERGLELGDWDIAPDATAIEAFARLAGPGAYQLYLAPQPAEQKTVPDVVGLVEALEQCITSMLDSGYRADAVVIRAARSAIAAHRKQGGRS